MRDSITIRHEMPCFSVTSEPELHTARTGKENCITKGITAPMPERCPKCGSIMHSHGVMMRRLRDIDLIGYLSIIEVNYDCVLARGNPQLLLQTL